LSEPPDKDKIEILQTIVHPDRAESSRIIEHFIGCALAGHVIAANRNAAVYQRLNPVPGSRSEYRQKTTMNLITEWN
jgi:hypothetical protein